MRQYNQMLQNIGILLLLMTACLFCQVVSGEDGAKKKSEPEKKGCEAAMFSGTYKIVGGEKEGETLDPKKMKATKVVIEGNRITTLDKEEGELYVAEFRLQPHDKGCYITMESIKPPMPGVGAIGLIHKEGNKVRLIYAFPDSEQPEEYKTSKGQHMFLMEMIDKSKDVEKVEAIPAN